MSKIMKLGALFLGITTVTSLTLVYLATNSKKQAEKNQNNESKTNSNLILNVDLSSFALETGNLDKSQTLASKYANYPTFIRYSYYTPKGDKDFWKKQLIFKTLFTKDKLNKEKLFGFNQPNGLTLNYFLSDYNLDFKSYANDIEGTLYLKVIFKNKSANYLSDNIEYVYELKGFQKYSEEVFQDGMYVKNISWNESEIKKFDNINKLEEEYNKVKDNVNEKESFLRKIVSTFETSSNSSINFKRTVLEFDKTNNKVIFNTKLNAVVNYATKENLNNVHTVETEVSSKFEATFPAQATN
ncbi:MAG1430 family protein [Mycoplasmopsis edwardii]|uniref:Uncharacterized protein n=1 Tax=Mycoplasmopsis edwardii TaxID=53558 RepID=A0ACD4PJZ4_9BACT|nr:hypothetical protein [Mycoplasmopsis edwardii]WBP84124.1 hypothetical protein Me_995_000075 [Mycoplasmopsis edwardii]